MKNYLPLLFFFFLISACGSLTNSEKSLVVSDNQKYLSYPDGKPFLWIGDTAWELFHKLDREEAVLYLENRAEKGISVIQAVVLSEINGLSVPNAYGNLPLIDLDPEKPNEAYFKHVDFIVDKAEELGLFIGMLPTWGDKILSKHPGAGPVIFNQENARTFGEFLGKRYKDKPIIWILGGDRDIINEEVLKTWRAMAEGISSGDEGRNLISYHPRGASMSAYYLHNEDWLDFNMYQSGHSKHYTEVYNYAEHLSLLYPRKPFLDAEPAYEDIGVEFWNFKGFSKAKNEEDTTSALSYGGRLRDPSVYEKGFFTATDVRVHAYWNFLSGACGYTYGNNAIWQMWDSGAQYYIPCLYEWKEALDRPGADDLRHIRYVFEKRPFNKLIPDQSIIYGLNDKGENHIRASLAEDGSFMLIYLAKGQSVLVNMSKIKNQINASWYDPRNGEAINIGTYNNTGIMEFKPPSSGEGQDWLLVLDDADAKNPKL